jgi:hypothetical protein
MRYTRVAPNPSFHSSILVQLTQKAGSLQSRVGLHIPPGPSYGVPFYVAERTPNGSVTHPSQDCL